MPGKPSPGQAAKRSAGRWGFFSEIAALLASAFPRATTGQRAAILGICVLAVVLIGGGAAGALAHAAWPAVAMVAIAAVFLLSMVIAVLWIDRSQPSPSWCRHVPIYPPSTPARAAIRAALEEIRQIGVAILHARTAAISDHDVRANIFLLAKIEGPPPVTRWKLVIHPDFAIKMNNPGECQIQFKVGQGATGTCFRDGAYQLSRRQKSDAGAWEMKHGLTPELERLIDPKLKWIISFPLLKPGTFNEALGVLNIDGLAAVAEDDYLHDMATRVKPLLGAIEETLSLLPSTCVGMDQLGDTDIV